MCAVLARNSSSQAFITHFQNVRAFSPLDVLMFGLFVSIDRRSLQSDWGADTRSRCWFQIQEVI